jgi:hypothetical protein
MMVAIWKELGFRSYEAYIKSRLWWSIRQIILERDGRCCQICGNPSKIVHHIDYTKAIMLGQGDQHELITLCEPHHNFVEQSKRLSEKRTLLHQLFTQYTQNTLDEWQIWAKVFNTDIGYGSDRILEPKNNKKKKHKRSILLKKAVEKKLTEEPKSKLQSLRDDIDNFIKGHKKKKKKRSGYNTNYYINKNKREHHCKTLIQCTEESRKDFITDTVRRYNRKSAKKIRKYLNNHRPIIESLFEHPEASDKLKQIICSHPYFIEQLRNKETEYQKKRRIEQEEIVEILHQPEYRKIKFRKKTKTFGKLPTWKTNHKAKSFQGECPLIKYVQKPKQEETKETGLDKTITGM